MPSFLNSFYIFRGNYVKKFDYCFDSQKKKKKSQTIVKLFHDSKELKSEKYGKIQSMRFLHLDM